MVEETRALAPAPLCPDVQGVGHLHHLPPGLHILATPEYSLLCPTRPGVLLAGARCPPCEMPIFQNRLLSRFQTPRSRWSRVSSSYPPLHDARSAKSSAGVKDEPLTMKSSKRDTEGNPYDKRIRIFC